MTARGMLVRPAHGRYALGPWSDLQPVTGPDRQALVAQLATEYVAGASIRTLAETHGQPYGTVRTMLIREAGVTLRPRGGQPSGVEARLPKWARAELAALREQVEVLTAMVYRLRRAGHDMPNTDPGPETRPRHAQRSSL